MKRILTIIFCAIMIASCSEDTVIWNEEDRVKAYSAELVGKHADLIDHLDRVLRACEYRDRVLGGEDSQIVIDRYFSDAFWGLSYNEAKDKLKLLLSTGIIIGEISGAKPCHFGDVLYSVLPNTGTVTMTSCRYFTRADMTKVNEEYLVPDVIIDLDDPEKDLVCEWILKNYGKQH